MAAYLRRASLLTAHQIHSATAVVVERPWAPSERPRADALVTATPGMALGVLTADCAPVLFADPEAGVVAAAHAGWRGAIGGVLEATIAAMERPGRRAGPTSAAAVGPCIGQAAYEVGFDFEEEFLRRDPDSARFFAAPDADRAPARISTCPATWRIACRGRESADARSRALHIYSGG